MNQLNYGSSEACKRLVDAGIVLETDFYHTENEDGSNYAIRPKEDREKYVYCPAPSMAEVWRELPVGRTLYTLFDGDECFFWYTNSGGAGKVFSNTNPTDALIDLLIFARGRIK